MLMFVGKISQEGSIDMLSPEEQGIKRKMETWLNQFIYQKRASGQSISKADIAKALGCAPSSLSQYTNPKHPKKAPWEFQCKFCCLVGRTIEQLHPELLNVRLSA